MPRSKKRRQELIRIRREEQLKACLKQALVGSSSDVDSDEERDERRKRRKLTAGKVREGHSSATSEAFCHATEDEFNGENRLPDAPQLSADEDLLLPPRERIREEAPAEAEASLQLDVSGLHVDSPSVQHPYELYHVTSDAQGTESDHGSRLSNVAADEPSDIPDVEQASYLADEEDALDVEVPPRENAVTRQPHSDGDDDSLTPDSNNGHEVHADEQDADNDGNNGDSDDSDVENPSGPNTVSSRLKQWYLQLLTINASHDVSTDAATDQLEHVFDGIRILHEFVTVKKRRPPKYKNFRTNAIRHLPNVLVSAEHRKIDRANMRLCVTQKTIKESKIPDELLDTDRYKRLWIQLQTPVRK